MSSKYCLWWSMAEGTAIQKRVGRSLGGGIVSDAPEGSRVTTATLLYSRNEMSWRQGIQWSCPGGIFYLPKCL